MADSPFPTNAVTAAIMWGLFALGLLLGIVTDSVGVMIVVSSIGAVIHVVGLFQADEEDAV
ncbi:hypothetical protein [Salinibacter ruber]|jgi:hypothetical protein|uniref:Uncharacterized protein n=1 Tax=Salinibacter ruber TaxID=146919 RepID=A0A9X2UC16_9BACT|nr:hypothetical protein [Salinibacter ruber]MCS3953382.1 hypothetical protein [Salinibacter ruber]